jgi:hypothetical protein
VSPRVLRAAAAATLLGLGAGCASLIPTGTVLESMKDEDVDVVAKKVSERYPQFSRLLVSEPFVIVLDSVVVPQHGEAWKDDEAKLVGTTASYMLGEEIGRDWVARVSGERAVIGEGQVFLSIYRATDGKRYLFDGVGMFDLFLPQTSTDGKTGAIESLSFDLKIANQAAALTPDGGTVELYGEIIPRRATYTSGGMVFRRWASSLYHLGWDQRALNGNAPKTPVTGDAAIAGFLENARAFIGPVVRLKVKFEKGADGFHHVTTNAANAVELVLPNALVAGDRELEAAVARLSAAYPGRFVRRENELYIKVGYFFFHPDPTGATAFDPAAKDRAAELKRFRIPR